jgi:hypothetical protein
MLVMEVVEPAPGTDGQGPGSATSTAT